MLSWSHLCNRSWQACVECHKGRALGGGVLWIGSKGWSNCCCVCFFVMCVCIHVRCILQPGTTAARTVTMGTVSG